MAVRGRSRSGSGRHGAHSHVSDGSGSVYLRVTDEEAALDVMAPGFGLRRLDSISIVPGETRDLGEIELDPLQRIACRLERAAGGALHAAHEVRYTDASGVTRRAQASADGEIKIPYSEGPPTSVQVRLQSGTSAPRATASIVHQPDGTGRIAVPEWESVIVTVSGIPMAERYLLDHLLVHPAGQETDRPNTSYWPGFRGVDLLSRIQLPPAHWTITSGKPRLVQLEPTTVEISGTPGTSIQHLRVQATSLVSDD